jgi:hypothetical protein
MPATLGERGPFSFLKFWGWSSERHRLSCILEIPSPDTLPGMFLPHLIMRLRL